MNDGEKTREQLLQELSSIRQQISGLEALQAATTDLSNTLEQLTYELGEKRRRVMELEALHTAGRALSSAQSPHQALTLILDALNQIVPFESATVQRIHHGHLQLVAASGLANPDAQQSYAIDADGPLASMLHSAAAVILNGVRDAGIGAHIDTSLQSWLLLPLLIAGRMIGILSLGHSQPDRYGDDDAARGMTFAEHAAIAVELQRLQEVVKQRTAEMDLVFQASQSLTSSLDLRDVLHSIVEGAFKLLHGPKDIHVFLYENGALTFGSAIWDGKFQDHPINQPRRGGLTYTVAETGEPVIVPDMRKHPIYANAPADWQGAIVGLPLKIGSRVVGVMNFTYPQPQTLDDDDLRLLMMLASQAAIAIENARLYAAVQQELVEHKRAEEERARLQEEIIQVQAQTLAELSTPLIPITDKVVVMPLVGATDQQRAQRILETLLHGVEEHRARVAIIDITGVPVFDTHVASTIITAAQAVRLLGAEVVLTGIRPEIAETLVGLGVDFRGLVTYSNLQSGISYSLRSA